MPCKHLRPCLVGRPHRVHVQRRVQWRRRHSLRSLPHGVVQSLHRGGGLHEVRGGQVLGGAPRRVAVILQELRPVRRLPRGFLVRLHVHLRRRILRPRHRPLRAVRGGVVLPPRAEGDVLRQQQLAGLQPVPGKLHMQRGLHPPHPQRPVRVVPRQHLQGGVRQHFVQQLPRKLGLAARRRDLQVHLRVQRGLLRRPRGALHHLPRQLMVLAVAEVRMPALHAERRGQRRADRLPCEARVLVRFGRGLQPVLRRQLLPGGAPAQHLRVPHRQAGAAGHVSRDAVRG
mmetsp:Transcript_31778/g.62044  ORF Transcript_31778/g.62044 Transcript_31778/m.62044 type:complete len:286 (+) Transcript_31778:1229-2086(+)